MARATLPVREKLTMGGDTLETWCKGYFNASPGIPQEDDILIPQRHMNMSDGKLMK